MTTLALQSLPPFEPLPHPTNTPFQCVYRNPNGEESKVNDITVDNEHWRIVVELNSEGYLELSISRTEELHELFEDDLNVQVFVKISNPSGEDFFLEDSGFSRKKFTFLLVDYQLSNLSASLFSLDFLVQIKATKIRKDENYRCSTFQRMCSDLVLILEGQKFFVCAEFLAKKSVFFAQTRAVKNQLPKDEESGLPLLSLPGVNYLQFVELMEIVVHPDEITVKSIDSAPLELAHYLLFDSVLSTFETFLLLDEFDFFSLCQKFHFAKTYSLLELEEVCLERLAKLSTAEMRMDNFFGVLAPETTREILEERFQRKEEERIQKMQENGNFANYMIPILSYA